MYKTKNPKDVLNYYNELTQQKQPSVHIFRAISRGYVLFYNTNK